MLTDKKKLFVEAFMGDPEQAARIAGYKGTSFQLRLKGEELLSDRQIQKALKHRVELEAQTNKIIATRQERQGFWSEVMRGKDPYASTNPDDPDFEPPTKPPLAVRLKASEMLGKSEADFVDRVDMNVQHSISDIITQAYAIDDKDIELDELDYGEVVEPLQIEELEEDDVDVEDLI